MNEIATPGLGDMQPHLPASVPCSKAGKRVAGSSAGGKPPMALKAGERAQLSRALRVKEESK